MYSGIQTSKVTLDTICMQNAQVYHYATQTKNIGKEFTSEYVGRPEKFFNKDPWLYKINKHGFRGDNWNFKPSIAVFGCSNIFGIGVEKSVTGIMSELLDQPVHNLGVPGGSSTHIIKTFVSFANLHPVTDAIISLPAIQRVFRPNLRSDISGWNWQNKIHYDGETDYKLMKAIDRVWNNDVTISHIADLIDWAESVAKTKDINIHWTSWWPNNLSSSNKNVEFHVRDLTSNFFMWPDVSKLAGCEVARDGEHPGPTTIKELALNCINAIENN